MFDTYIINLEKEITNYIKLKKLLEDKNYKNIYRFNAIYGKNIKNINDHDAYTRFFFKYCIPYSVLGNGLSHYYTLDTIYKNRENKKNNNNNNNNNNIIKNDYALILEDDVVPLCNYKKLNKIIKSLHKDVDILVLYRYDIINLYQKIFGYKSNNKKIIKRDPLVLGLPCCAYLVRIESIPKILKYKLWYYFDVLQFNNPLKMDTNVFYYHKNLFETSYEESHNLNTNYSNTLLYKLFENFCNKYNIGNLLFFFFFKIGKIPFINLEFTTFDIIYINVFIIIIIIAKYIFYKLKI